MKRKNIFLLIILVLILVITGVIYIKFLKKENKNSENLDEKSIEFNLPLLAWKFEEKNYNTLYPYKLAMSNNITYDSLNILPEDRNISFSLFNNKKIIAGISYEIRDLKGELIENTKLDEIENKSGDFDFTLPIQNIIVADKEYILKIQVDTKENEKSENSDSLYYYSRIRYYDESRLYMDMLNLATDFSIRNFDYDSARANTTYLETDGSINSQALCDVTLKSSFDMLTYNNLKLEVNEKREVRLISYDGNVGEVHINSLASRKNDNGETENYEIEENFVFRRGEERLYMLDYHRKMKEIFEASKYNFTGTRLLLGIVSESDISSKISEDKRYVAFSSLRDLFLYDNDDNEITKVYYNTVVDDILYRYPKYDIKILSVDSTQLKFMVYGYMKEGEYEARLGTALYSYDIETKKLNQLAFIEDFTSFEELKNNIEDLSYLNKNEVLYLRKADEIYSINLNTKELNLELTNIENNKFASSDNGRYISYVKDNALYMQDLESGKIQKKSFEADVRLDISGFIDSDVIIGLSNSKDDYELHGKIRAAKKNELRILSSNLELLKNYISPNNYIDNIRVDEDIVRFDIFEKNADGAYNFIASDSIVSSNSKDRKDGIGYYASESKTIIYYIQTPKNYAVSKIKINFIKAKTKAGNSDFVLSKENKSSKYFVFVAGSLKGIYYNLDEAIKPAYDNMGYVLNKGQIVYSRAASTLSASNEISKEEANEYLSYRENEKLISLFGIELNQALYYVSKGIKVLTYNSSGEALIIYAYDRYNISVFNINTARTYKIGRADATADFNLSYNDYYIMLNLEN